jgi:hypothetical protein
MNDEKLKTLPMLSFNDVKECCSDDSAGGGCLYLHEEKLMEKLRDKVQNFLNDAHALMLNDKAS